MHLEVKVHLFGNNTKSIHIVLPKHVEQFLQFLAPLTFVRRSLYDTNLSVIWHPAAGGVRQLFQIATPPTFPIRFS